MIKELFINLGLKEKMKKQVQVIKIEIIRHGRLLKRAPYIKVIFSFYVAKRPGRSERAGSGLYHFGLFWRQSPCGSPSLRSHMDLSENRKGDVHHPCYCICTEGVYVDYAFVVLNDAGGRFFREKIELEFLFLFYGPLVQ